MTPGVRVRLSGAPSMSSQEGVIIGPYSATGRALRVMCDDGHERLFMPQHLEPVE